MMPTIGTSLGGTGHDDFAHHLARDVMKHIFISHKGVPDDVNLARELRKQLIAIGYSVFLDAENLKVGDEWATRITEELRRADALLLLMSGSAVSSDMVIEEVRIARDLKRELGRPLILPVAIGGMSRSALPYD